MYNFLFSIPLTNVQHISIDNIFLWLDILLFHKLTNSNEGIATLLENRNDTVNSLNSLAITLEIMKKIDKTILCRSQYLFHTLISRHIIFPVVRAFTTDEGEVYIIEHSLIKGDIRRQRNEVKGFTQTDTETLTEAKETAQNGTITNTHNEQVNGITTNEQKQSHQEKETAITRPKWYQTILAKIGGLCCIAALLWLLFLYLKRKF